MKILLSEVIKFGQMILGLYFKDFSYDNNKFLALYIKCVSSLPINNIVSITTQITNNSYHPPPPRILQIRIIEWS